MVDCVGSQPLFAVKSIPLHCVFHGIRFIRFLKIGCRETAIFFFAISTLFKKKHYLCSQF